MTTSSPWVLGISYSHNGAACLLHGDELVVAIQEERLTGVKRARITNEREPLAVRYCLDYAGIQPSDLACVVANAQAGNRDTIVPESHRLASVRTLTISHHRAHAVSAFATSGFEDAAVLVVDGMGGPSSDFSADETRASGGKEGYEIISIYRASGVAMEALDKLLVPEGAWIDPPEVLEKKPGLPAFRSLGGMFSAIAYLVFGDLMEAGKVMGLAPYGRPTIPTDEFFEVVGDELVFNQRVADRFRESGRWPANESAYRDLCASAQRALEDALDWLASRARARTGARRLCYAGGVALNSVANERLVQRAGFDDVFILPAAEDSGCAVGCAYHGLWELGARQSRRRLGPDATGRRYPRAEMQRWSAGIAAIEKVESDDVTKAVAEAIAEGKIVGWFEGGSELGPRSLGQRSILCDPRRPDGKDVLNARVKHREAFRPFAPAVLAEHAAEWFEPTVGGFDSPYMLRVLEFKESVRALVPAVVHVDGTGRVQTVTRANGPFHDLLRCFARVTGVPMLLNTSFNLMGEPIVETPEDALWCLALTGLDLCAVEGELFRKRPDAPAALDLVPTVLADLSLSRQADGSVRLGAKVTTPWGSTHLPIAPGLQLTVELSDGKRSFRDILQHLQRVGVRMTESTMTRNVAVLRRTRVIGLTMPSPK